MSLLNAIRKGDTVRATRLLAQGANPNGTGSGVSLTPLHYAIAKGNLTMVRRLVHYGANINNAILIATAGPFLSNNTNRLEQIIDFLLKAGARIPLSALQKITLLNIPNNNQVRLIRKLVKKGASQNAMNIALRSAFNIHSHKVIQTLVRLGAHVQPGLFRNNWVINAAARGLAQRVKARQRRNVVSRLNAEFRQKKALNMLQKTVGKKQFNTPQGVSTLPPNVLKLIAQKSTPVKVKKYPNNNRNRNIFYNARSQFNNNN